MTAHLPKYVLNAGMNVVHTYADWMNYDADADGGDEEGQFMDAHADAIRKLRDVLARDPMVAVYLRDEELAEFLGADGSR